MLISDTSLEFVLNLSFSTIHFLHGFPIHSSWLTLFLLLFFFVGARQKNYLLKLPIHLLHRYLIHGS